MFQYLSMILVECNVHQLGWLRWDWVIFYVDFVWSDMFPCTQRWLAFCAERERDNVNFQRWRERGTLHLDNRCELETCILSMAMRQVLLLPIKGVPIYKQRQSGGCGSVYLLFCRHDGWCMISQGCPWEVCLSFYRSQSLVIVLLWIQSWDFSVLVGFCGCLGGLVAYKGLIIPLIHPC